MSVYSFKKEAKVYIVYNNEYYNITVSAIDFSQTLAVKTKKSKTLHEPLALFSGVVIDKYNPATFSLSYYAIRENDFKVLFNRALDTESFDIYVQTQADTYKIEGAVVSNLSVDVSKTEALGLSYQGEAQKLSLVGDETYVIPGTEVPRDSVQTYNRINYVDIVLNTTTQARVNSLTLELQNKIKWVLNDTIASCGTTSVPTYPGNYVIEEKSLAGTFTTNTVNTDTYGLNDSLSITVGQLVNSVVYGFSLDSDNIAYTSRINSGSIFTQSFDWRVVGIPSSLSEIFTYTTYAAGTAGAILDYLGNSILDYQDEAILENT